jgi:formate hydrogenlyase subunit 3/multisubunit Na+/H+ antiporter MnhD subunit
MTLILCSFIIFIASGLASFCFSLAGKKHGPCIGAWGAVCAAVIGCIPAVGVLAGRHIEPFVYSWSLFLGSFCLKLDMLSAFFLLVILIITAFSAVYGLGYLKDDHNPDRLTWFFFNLLGASMAMVCVAGNAVLFLLAWEVMALSSFFLVISEHEKTVVRKAAWIYMVATYLGTICLLPMFLMLGTGSVSLDFGMLGRTGQSRLADACFILALIGFGAKAGIMPFHVWLPDAHPAAPSHVSALMSGVMIKTGIYGLLRIMTFLGTPHLWWGITLIVIGAVSGILGVLFALAQHDIKRLLAYHSVENIGIIFIGLGIGFTGICTGVPVVAMLGFAGALLHVVNHALFKSLLFMGAGAVYRKTHTREMDMLGGVIKKMPITGVTFLIGAAAISGLPPLNGFVSEFLIYAASFFGIVRQQFNITLPLAAAVTALALIGGLAASCFAKAFGIVFLGEPRSVNHKSEGEVGPLMLTPMIACAALCCIIGLLGPIAAGKSAAVALSLFGLKSPPEFASVSVLLVKTCGVLWALTILITVFYFVRNLLLRNRSVRTEVTWDCGYSAGTSRMQYTASSFAQPIIDLFAGVLGTEKSGRIPEKYFPAKAEFSSETPDAGNERIYRPIFSHVTSFLARFGILQQGRIQIYVLYIVIALMTMLFWRLR